jgi:hypothetical protein
MTTPNTIVEQNGRLVVANARPRAMRAVIVLAASVAVALVLLSVIGDVQTHHWFMIPVRLVFALVIGLAAMFSLFGAESVAIEGQELVWRRGESQERRAAVGDIERLEREGNHLRVHVRGEAHPIIIGAGLRQSPQAMQWLTDELDARLTAARKGTRPR